ncbi:MAG: hypothetical protein P4L99_14870, partial [Chthoniobacter sp.]|nr:hypothetical protein [Chthoniobacter sp.]
HRANLVGMGVLPLQFAGGQDRRTLGLTGADRFTITDLGGLEPLGTVRVVVEREDGSRFGFETLCRIDTRMELRYFMGGGILTSIARAIG